VPVTERNGNLSVEHLDLTSTAVLAVVLVD